MAEACAWPSDFRSTLEHALNLPVTGYLLCDLFMCKKPLRHVPDMEEKAPKRRQVFGPSGDLPLEKAMKKFEQGIKLTRSCQAALKDAEQKVEILLKSAGGEAALEAFEPDED